MFVDDRKFQCVLNSVSTEELDMDTEDFVRESLLLLVIHTSLVAPVQNKPSVSFSHLVDCVHLGLRAKVYI